MPPVDNDRAYTDNVIFGQWAAARSAVGVAPGARGRSTSADAAG